jgi:ribose 1,5-bisphosphokinase
MTEAPRFALYFAPQPSSKLSQLGDAWIGRLAELPEFRYTLEKLGLDVDRLHRITQHPRRYGFHATLKAPFHLAKGHTPDMLLKSVEDFARTESSFALSSLSVSKLDDFLALVTHEHSGHLNAFASRCVTTFDTFRREITAQEIARRRQKTLSPQEDAMMLRWGYPYVLDCYRFHLTLTDSLSETDAAFCQQILTAAVQVFNAELLRGVCVDAITVFEEPHTGADFRPIFRAPLKPLGRLIYVVGASGVGKDSLLQWARSSVSRPTQFLFTRRVVTRMVHGDYELHEALGEAEFNTLASAGAFAMQWEAHGHQYGIRSDIDDALREAKTVIVNGSRAHLPIAHAQYPHLEVVHIVAPAAILDERLQRRGRETAVQVAARRERDANSQIPLPIACEISNAGTIDVAGRQLLQFLENNASPTLPIDPQ